MSVKVAEYELQTKTDPLSWVIRIAALVAIIAFFLPFCAVSCYGEEVDLSAGEIAIGRYKVESDLDDYADEAEMEEIGESCPLALLLPIMSIVVFILGHYLAFNIGNRNLSIANNACGGSIFFITLIVQNKVEDYVKDNSADYESKIGFYLLLFAGIVISAAALYIWIKTVIYEQHFYSSTGSVRTTNSPATWFCSSCGTRCSPSARFCEKCGTPRFGATEAAHENTSSQPASGQANDLSQSGWSCKHCGARNPITYSSCKDCGEYR